MANEEIQAIVNETFAGVTFFCRDTSLSEELIGKYETNQLLLERGFTDVSYKVGGMGQNCRYLIASSKGKDMSVFSPNPEYGHIVIASGAYYKVLDIQQINGKTQILLLNIPPQGLQLFASTKFNIETQIIAKGLESFQRSIATEPLPELQAKGWVKRTAFPVGMNESGDFFLQPYEKSTLEPTANSETKDTAPANTPEHNPDGIKGDAKQEKFTPKKGGIWSKLLGK